MRPEISPTLEQIVMRALATDPAARYSRADDFARALNELAVREGLTVGAEEVGNYVRAMCPEEFAAERQLQSKLSMMRQKSGAEDERRKQWSEPEPVEMGGTLVRPSHPELGAAEMTPAQRAISVVSSSPNPDCGRTVVRSNASPAPRAAGVKGGTVVRGEAVKVDDGSGPLVVPRSKAPLYGVLGALVLGALGVAAYSLLGGPSEPLPARVAEPSAGTGDEKVPTGEGTKGEEPHGPAEPPRGELDAGSGTAREPTKVVERREPGLGMVDVVGMPVPVRVDDDVVVVLVARGAKAPFEEGDAVLLVGEPTGKRAPLYAHGTVVDVKPTMVKIMASDGNLGSGANLFALKDVAKRAAVEKPVAVARPKRTSPPSEWKTIEPKGPSEPAREPVAEAPRSVPMKTEAPKEVKNDAPARAASSGLRGVIGVSPASTPGGQIVRIVNQNPIPLTGCIVRLASNRTAAIQLIGPNSDVKLRYSVFHPDAKPPDPNFQQGWSAVYCREGTGYFFTTFGSR